MTNLEFYKDFIVERFNEFKQMSKEDRNIHELNIFHSKIGSAICSAYMKDKEIYGFGSISCKEIIDWLLEEHKEPIKLKQWEKDLLMVFYNFTDSVKLTLDNAIIISPMLRAGYFQGVPDTSMTIKEILDNCEVTND